MKKINAEGLEYMLGDLNQFVTENGFSDQTRLGYADKLRRLAEWLAAQNLDFRPGRLTSTLFLAFLDELKWGGNGRYAMVCATKSYLRWRYKTHPILNLRVRRPKPKPQRTLDVDQVTHLLESIDTSHEGGIRTLAMVTLMLDAGLRRVEIGRLQIDYLNLRKRRVEVEIKGGEWGTGTFSPYTASCLEAWLAVRARIVNETDSHTRAIFVSLQGETRGQPVKSDSVKKVFERLSIRSDVPFSSHDLRRTFATLAVKRGAPTRIVQKAGRWKTLDMVERYTQAIDAEDMQPYSPVDGIMNDAYGDGE